jgi:hypothetical protein
MLYRTGDIVWVDLSKYHGYIGPMTIVECGESINYPYYARFPSFFSEWSGIAIQEKDIKYRIK